VGPSAFRLWRPESLDAVGGRKSLWLTRAAPGALTDGNGVATAESTGSRSEPVSLAAVGREPSRPGAGLCRPGSSKTRGTAGSDSRNDAQRTFMTDTSPAFGQRPAVIAIFSTSYRFVRGSETAPALE
jgi:hypothetical protein